MYNTSQSLDHANSRASLGNLLEMQHFNEQRVQQSVDSVCGGGGGWLPRPEGDIRCSVLSLSETVTLLNSELKWKPGNPGDSYPVSISSQSNGVSGLGRARFLTHAGYCPAPPLLCPGLLILKIPCVS